MVRAIAGCLLLIAMASAAAQIPFPSLADPIQTFANEDKDWGVSSSASPKRPPYHAKTPTSIPGARVIKTLELSELLTNSKDIVVVDVLDSRERVSVPGAHWIVGLGESHLFASDRERLSTELQKATGGDKKRPIVFLCVSAECWMSYNAALHAQQFGYQDVIWYRGGTNAWRDAGFPLVRPNR